MSSIKLPFWDRWQPEAVYLDWGSRSFKYQVGQRAIQSQAGCVVYHPGKQSVVSWGTAAVGWTGKLPPGLRQVWPVKQGAVVDIEAATLLMRSWWQSWPHAKGQRYHLYVAVPTLASPVERSIMSDAFGSAGIHAVTLVNQADCLVYAAQHSGRAMHTGLLIMIGSTYSEVVVLHDNQIKAQRTWRWGSDNITTELQKLLHTEYQCQVSWQTIQAAQWSIAQLPVMSTGVAGEQQVTMRGKHALTHLPVTLTLTNVMCQPVLDTWSLQVRQELVSFLATLPATVRESVLAQGVWLTGGGSRVKKVEQYLADILDCSVSTALQPELSVLQGLQGVMNGSQKD